MLTNKQKKEVSKAANMWVAKSKDRSQAKLSDAVGINKAYMSNICKEVFQINHAERAPSPISDKVFYRIAAEIGLQLEFRPHFNSEPHRRILKACAFTQKMHRRFIIDSKASGMTKTYTLEKYAAENENVVYVKCTSLMKGKDLIQLLLDKLHISFEKRVSNTVKLNAITKKILETPGILIIIDEFENPSMDMLLVVKDIEDATYQQAGFILCGMGLIAYLKAASQNNRKLGPQLWRRFRNYTLRLGSYSPDYTINGLIEHGIENDEVIAWITDRVQDFGRLSEYVKDIHDHLIIQDKEVTVKEVESLFKPL
ncbi:MAG: ATP-binding protein [Marinoscillum sp.]|uniref:AAA family ATPase n=1 Tax=Marinoscillum sp. TaxID=2024838 RepID=UPI0032F1893D